MILWSLVNYLSIYKIIHLCTCVDIFWNWLSVIFQNGKLAVMYRTTSSFTTRVYSQVPALQTQLVRKILQPPEVQTIR